MNDTLHVPCPHCAALNRVPPARLRESPSCGKCKQPLFTGHPVALDVSTFDRHIGGELPVVVDFWADWCGPCKRLAPTIDALALEYAGKVTVGKLDVDANPNTPGKYAVRGIPALLVFKGGQLVDQIVGLQPKENIKAVIDRHL